MTGYETLVKTACDARSEANTLRAMAEQNDLGHTIEKRQMFATLAVAAEVRLLTETLRLRAFEASL